MFDVSVSQSELARMLQIAEGTIQKRPTMPVLHNVLLVAKDKKLQIVASDLDVSVQTSCPAEVKSSGSTTVNASVFGAVVRELPEGAVHLSVSDGERLDVAAGHSRVKIVGRSAEAYPTVQGLELQPKGRILAKQLLEMVHGTIYSVSSDETRPNLCGVCFELLGGKNPQLCLAATDGYRLALATRPVSNFKFDGRVIVPRKGLSELKSILNGLEEKEIAFDIVNGFLVLDTNITKIAVRLTDAEFPAYDQVVPKEPGTKLTINSAEFAQALRRVSVVVSDKQKGVKFEFSGSNAKLSSATPELGEASEEISFLSGKTDKFAVGFNARYLLDVIAAFGEGETLVAEFHAARGPGVFYRESDESLRAVVMPMRV